MLCHPYHFKRPHTLHKAHKESDLLINAGNYLLIVSRSRCQLSYPGSSQLNRIQSAFQSKTIPFDCHSCRAPAVLTYGFWQLRRSARPRVPGVGTWRPSQGSRGCWPLRQPSPSSGSHRRTQTSGPEKPHGTHASCKDADLHGGSGLAALRRCGISQLCCKYTALLF